MTKYQKKYAQTEKGKAVLKKASKKYWKRVCQTTIFIYGGKCQVCGFDQKVCLQWHHTERKKPKETKQDTVLRILKAGKKVSDVMLLCANCHIIADIEDGTSLRGINNVY